MERTIIRVAPKRIDLGKGLFLRILICGYFALSVFEPYLNGLLGSLTKYYIFGLMVLLVVAHQFIELTAIHGIFIAWLCYKFISLLWSEDFTIPQMHWVSQIGMVAFLCVLLAIKHDKKTNEAIKLTYMLSSGGLGVLALFFSDAYQGTVEFRQVLTIFGIEIDPNNLAALMLIGISISLGFIFYEKRFMLLSVGVVAINTIGCFRSGSRAGLVTAVCLLIVCLVIGNKQQSAASTMKRLLLVAAVIAVIYFVTVKFVSSETLDRLFNFGEYEDGSGRMFTWINIWEYYTRNVFSVLFGSGWGSATVHTGSGSIVHNTFLTMLCDVGLVGSIVFFAPIVYVSIKLLKERNMVPLMVFAAGMVPSFFIDAINKRFFWNAIIILFVYYNYNAKNSVECWNQDIEVK